MTDIFRRGITRKIFTITLLLLFSAAIVWIGMIIYFLPGFYTEYKKATVQENTVQISKLLEQNKLSNAEALLDNFVNKNNVYAILIDNKTSDVVYVFSKLDVSNNPPHQDEPQPISVQNNNVMIDGNSYTLVVQATVKSTTEFISALYLFLPYILITVLIFAVLSSIIYSKIISDPLLRLYKTAQKLSRLDFSETSEVHSNDEIGELSKMLNELSYNLQRAMTGLQEVNTQLKDDIEKERIIETKRREFITTLSHDLKTPLTVIKGQLEGMLHNIGRYADRDKYLFETLKTADHMEELIQDMIRLVNLDDIENLSHRKIMSLVPYINGIPEEFAHFIEEKDLAVTIEIKTDDGRIDGESILVKQALHSVVMNAVVYAPEHAEIRIILSQGDQMVTVRVYNQGSHIDEADIPFVFDQFYRAEKSRNRYTGGSGIGLYIVRKIMQLHNGLATINNVENGVECCLYFPETAANIPTEKPEEKTTKKRKLNSSVLKKKKKKEVAKK